MEFSVLVGTCGSPHREFMISLVGMVIDFAENGRAGDVHRLGLFVQSGSILPQLRHRIAEQALAIGATHVLFADSDQSFPPHTLRQLLSHRLPVVGCNIATKMIPPSCTARKKGPHAGVPVSPSTGVERVWRLGLGLTLVETDVFRRVPRPWFNVVWRDEIQDYEGEDWFFCSRLEEAGIGIYVDHDLSEEVGHWGDFKYGLDLVLPKMERPEQFSRIAVPGAAEVLRYAQETRT